MSDPAGRESEAGMSSQKESQGVREPTADDGSVAATWDPYEVWLHRVKKPRDEHGATTIRTFRLDDSKLSDTARLRILTATQSR
jgi:hypothetical protein